MMPLACSITARWAIPSRNCRVPGDRRLGDLRYADCGEVDDALERIRDQLAANDVVLWSSAGQMIASTGQSRLLLNPERPSPQQLRNTRSQRSISIIEGLDDPGLQNPSVARIKAMELVPTTSFGLLAEPRFLQVTQSLPSTLVANAIAVHVNRMDFGEALEVALDDASGVRGGEPAPGGPEHVKDRPGPSPARVQPLR